MAGEKPTIQECFDNWKGNMEEFNQKFSKEALIARKNELEKIIEVSQEYKDLLALYREDYVEVHTGEWNVSEVLKNASNDLGYSGKVDDFIKLEQSEEYHVVTDPIEVGTHNSGKVMIPPKLVSQMREYIAIEGLLDGYDDEKQSLESDVAFKLHECAKDTLPEDE